jgi:hypothetical protein
MIRLVCIAEIEAATTVEEAQIALDKFREAVLPTDEHGITIYRATEADADASYYMAGEDDGAEKCDECGAMIPEAAEGGMENRHHFESCSLYDADKE